MTIRVVIADDQPLFRSGLGAILQGQPGIEVVDQVGDGEQAVRRTRQHHPDVVMMDVRMPVLDGIAATARITGNDGAPHPSRVIVLTTFDVDDYVYDALQAGASGFLLKDTEPEQLVDAVRTVAGGAALLAPTITRRLIENFVNSRPRALRSVSILGSLTIRERDVFDLVARGRSNTEIACELHIAEQTVKTHVSRILSKLHLRDRVHAVVLGYETGAVRPGRLPS